MIAARIRFITKKEPNRTTRQKYITTRILLSFTSMKLYIMFVHPSRVKIWKIEIIDIKRLSKPTIPKLIRS
jgi:hypothetical protein